MTTNTSAGESGWDALNEELVELYEANHCCVSPDAPGSAHCLGFGAGANAGWDAAIGRCIKIVGRHAALSQALGAEQ